MHSSIEILNVLSISHLILCFTSCYNFVTAKLTNPHQKILTQNNDTPSLEDFRSLTFEIIQKFN